MGELELMGKAMDRVLYPDFGGMQEADPDTFRTDAQIAQESWMRHTRKVADERKALVLNAIPVDRVSLRLMLSLLIEAERDHAKAEYVAVGK